MGIRKGLLIILFLLLGFTTFLYIHVRSVDNTVIPEVVVSDQTVSAAGDGMDAGSVGTAVSPADAPSAPSAGPVEEVKAPVAPVKPAVPKAAPPAPRKTEPVEVSGEVLRGKARITKYGWTGHKMANGEYPYEGAVATSDRTIPFGSKVIINGVEYVVKDRTASWIHDKYGLTFDIFSTESRQEMLTYGVKYVQVEVFYAAW